MGDGFVLVDKESGWTSHDVVAKCRGILSTRKIGHAGTLDPMATGLLVLGVGRATRLLKFVQGLTKEYVARALLGVATDTLDADGAVLERSPLPVSQAEVEAVLERFRGPIMQVPPMVSARKVEGRRLYELARQGKEVEREARPVEIHTLEITDFAPSDYPEVELRVRCSTGTYVRTLADDIGRALGGRAHLVSLRRTANGPLRVDDARTIGQLDAAVAAGESVVLPPAKALSHLAAIEVSSDVAVGVGNGVPLTTRQFDLALDEGQMSRVVGPDGRLLAVYRVEGARLLPDVVLS